jgi:hypothetical protein
LHTFQKQVDRLDVSEGFLSDETEAEEHAKSCEPPTAVLVQ